MQTDPRTTYEALDPKRWSERAADRRALFVQDVVDRLGRQGAVDALSVTVARIDAATSRARRLTDEERAAALALDLAHGARVEPPPAVAIARVARR